MIAIVHLGIVIFGRPTISIDSSAFWSKNDTEAPVLGPELGNTYFKNPPTFISLAQTCKLFLYFGVKLVILRFLPLPSLFLLFLQILPNYLYL